MARPREFDTEALLDSVSMAFLESGLQLTSMRHLEDLTGVKQVSLYNAFGSKEGLFLAAFDRYTERVTAAQQSHLDDRGLDGIESFVKAIVSPDSPLPLAHFGCLIVNTALVAESAGPAIKSRVQVFRQQMHARFVGALTRAKSRHELKRGLNLDQCAEFVLSAVWGMFVTIRLSDDDQTVGQPAASALVKTLRDWSQS
jgi:TetR/AcrR family transcriptional repressor of nem operon